MTHISRNMFPNKMNKRQLAIAKLQQVRKDRTKVVNRIKTLKSDIQKFNGYLGDMDFLETVEPTNLKAMCKLRLSSIAEKAELYETLAQLNEDIKEIEKC